MARVTTRWTPFTTTPIIGSTTYPSDIDVRNTEMASRMTEIDTMGQEMNDVADEVDANGVLIAGRTIATEEYKNAAEAAAAQASADADRAESAVPIGDGYNMDTVDAKDKRITKLSSVASGYTIMASKSKRWKELDDPYKILDILADDVVIDGEIVSRVSFQETTLQASGTDVTTFVVDDGTEYTVDEYVGLYKPNGNNLVAGKITDISTNTITIDETFTREAINYIIKILPVVEFDKAPFASGSTDELLNDAVNGVTTQSDHSVGDLIVTGNELVTGDNSTFDTTVGDWAGSNITISVVSGKLNVVGLAGNAFAELEISNLIPNEKYLLIFDFEFIDKNGVVQIRNSANTAMLGSSIAMTESSDNTAIEFTMDSATSMKIWLRNQEGTTGTHKWDNVRLILKDTIYQNIATSTADDLLTDTNKFQVLTRVTTHDILRDTTTGYDAVRGLNLFAAGVSNDTIASTSNYSKLGNGLYHDGTQEVTISALRTTLNGGAYHPIYNSKGCRQFSDNENWNDTTDTVLSVYDCYANRSSSTTSGRPDGKVENIVYYEQIIFKGTYSQQANEHDLLAEPIDLDMAESCGVESYGYYSTVTVGSGLVEGQRYVVSTGESGVDEGFSYSLLVNVGIAVIDGTPYFIRNHYWSGGNSLFIINKELHGTPSISSSVSLKVILFKKANHNLTQGQPLSPEILADPVNYPSDWLSHLAGGNSVDMNMALVNQDGTSSIPTNGTPVTHIASEKVIANMDTVYIKYDGSSSGTASWDYDLVTNEYTDGGGSTVADYIWITNYTSQNEPYTQSDPMPVQLVQPKVIATNSHSIFKSAMLTKCVTGKIAVGNGDRGYESKTLENAELGIRIHVVVDGTYTVDTGEYVQILDDSFTYASLGEVYKRTGVSLTSTVFTQGSSFHNPAAWLPVDAKEVFTTPEHPQITLSDDTSPASKVFKTLAIDSNSEYCIQVFGDELVDDASVYDGDDGEFNQLTNGTETDLNGKTIRTFCGFTRTGVFSV